MPVIIASYLNVKDLPNEDIVASNIELLKAGYPEAPEPGQDKKFKVRRMSTPFEESRKLFMLRKQYDVRMNSLYRILYNN